MSVFRSKGSSLVNGLQMTLLTKLRLTCSLPASILFPFSRATMSQEEKKKGGRSGGEPISRKRLRKVLLTPSKYKTPGRGGVWLRGKTLWGSIPIPVQSKIKQKDKQKHPNTTEMGGDMKIPKPGIDSLGRASRRLTRAPLLIQSKASTCTQNIARDLAIS